MGKDFLYFLMTADDRFYYEDNGVLMISGTPKPVQSTPDGWLDLEITKMLSDKYYGIDRTFSIPLDFVNDGGFIIKSLYYQYGVEAKVLLVITQRLISFSDDIGVPLLLEDGTRFQLEDDGGALLTEDVPEYGVYYSLLVKAAVNFTEFSHEGPRVTTRLLEAGVSQILKSDENTKVEIFLGDDAELIRFDGVVLQGGGTFQTVSMEVDILSESTILPINLVGDETRTATARAQSQYYQASSTQPGGNEFKVEFQTTASGFDDLGGEILSTDTANTFHFDGRIEFDYPYGPGNTQATRFYVVTSTNRLLLFQLVDIHGFDLNHDFTLEAGERLFFGANSSPLVGGSPYGVRLKQNDLTLRYKSRKGTTYIKAYRGDVFFKKLAAKNGIPNAKSDALSKKFTKIFITCGDAVRGLPGVSVKTSMSDFFTSLNVPCCLGMTISKEVLILEEKSTMYDFTKPLDLGQSKNARITPSKEHLISGLKIGYPEQDYTDVNGRQEFNNTLEFTTPVKSVSKVLELVSIYRTDCFGMEFLRANFDGRTTTDSSSDNDVFMVYCEDERTVVDGVSAYNLNRDLNATVTNGLLEPDSVFNLWFSPKSCVYRQGPYIRSFFYKMDDGDLIFTTAPKNKDLVFNTLTEGADVHLSTLGVRLFTPNIIEFETIVAPELRYLFRSNVGATFMTWINDIPFVGLPIKSVMKPATNASQTFTMLSAPQNDMLAGLRDYWG
ncbi:MAG TPA: hypothetical protein VK666_07875 [Chryseolinea sp.]|nr:hypothetical protein [Chryseolinea sp.]